MRKLAPVMALLWLATVAANPPPAPTPTPEPTSTAPPPPTPTAQPHGSVNLSAAAGPAATKVTVTGSGFLPGEPIAIFLDTTDHPLGGSIADGGGNFHQDVTIPDGTAVGTHIVCVHQQPQPRCAQFQVQTPPTPTPTDTPTPTPTPSPSPSATVQPVTGSSTGGSQPASALAAFVTSPFGIILILLLLAALAASIFFIIRSRQLSREPLRPGGPGGSPGASMRH